VHIARNAPSICLFKDVNFAHIICIPSAFASCCYSNSNYIANKFSSFAVFDFEELIKNIAALLTVALYHIFTKSIYQT